MVTTFLCEINKTDGDAGGVSDVQMLQNDKGKFLSYSGEKGQIIF